MHFENKLSSTSSKSISTRINLNAFKLKLKVNQTQPKVDTESQPIINPEKSRVPRGMFCFNLIWMGSLPERVVNDRMNVGIIREFDHVVAQPRKLKSQIQLSSIAVVSPVPTATQRRLSYRHQILSCRILHTKPVTRTNKSSSSS